jgi:hypothetical protein
MIERNVRDNSLVIRYKRSLIKVEEVWNKGKLKLFGNGDITINTQLLLNPSEEHELIKYKDKKFLEVCVPNYVIDLRQDEEELYKKLNKSTRRDIRKASEKDGLTYYETDSPTDEEIEEFSSFYNSFAKSKKIALCNSERLLMIRNKNSLIMTSVKDSKNHTLCSGMLLQDKENKQLYGIYGVSGRLTKTSNEERRLNGRANKYLHWMEIQSTKKRGMDWYNFGGEVFEEQDKGVNDFKLGFGAIQKLDRRVYIANSLIGRVCVYLLFRKWKKNFNLSRLGKEPYIGTSGATFLSIFISDAMSMPFI